MVGEGAAGRGGYPSLKVIVRPKGNGWRGCSPFLFFLLFFLFFPFADLKQKKKKNKSRKKIPEPADGLFHAGREVLGENTAWQRCFW
jgi:hypothetical protein